MEVYQQEISSENLVEEEKNTLSSLAVYSIIAVGALLVLIIGGVWYTLRDPVVSFQIVNIPYVGKHNNEGYYRQPYSRNDVAASIITVLEYWAPGAHDIEDIDTAFLNSPLGYKDIRNYIQKIGGYDIWRESLQASELSKYINKNSQTPLITFLPLAEDQRGLNYFPATVLVGVDEKEKTLLFYSYWYGADYKISFEEFNRLQKVKPTDDQYSFIVIRPEGLLASDRPEIKGKIREYTAPVLAEEVIDLYRDYALASGALTSKEYSLAKYYFEQLVGSEYFDIKLSPIHKVLVLSRLIEVLNVLGEYDQSIQIGTKVVDLNHDLDKPFEYFGSYDYLLNNNAPGFTDRLSLPHIVLGDAFRDIGMFAEAADQYRKALEIYPRHSGVKRSLDSLEITNVE